MRKFLALMLVLVLVLSVFASCGNNSDNDESKENDDVTTNEDQNDESNDDADESKDTGASDESSAEGSDDKKEEKPEEQKSCNHVYDNACDTVCNTCNATRTVEHTYATVLTKGESNHYYECSVCKVKKDEAAHVYDKTVVSDDYLKAAATATTKAQYFKSCVCGAKSTNEYFETDKRPVNLQVSDISKTYDGTPVAEPTVTFDGVGAENFAYYKGDEKLTERPTDAGTYKVVVTVDETETHASQKVEKAFTIAPKKLTMAAGTSKIVSSKTYDGIIYSGTSNFGPTHPYVLGVIEGETVSVNFNTNQKNKGNYSENVTLTCTNANYDISELVLEYQITAKNLDVSSISFSKVYDGSYEIRQSIPGLIGGETLSLTVQMKKDGVNSGDVGATGASAYWAGTATPVNYTMNGVHSSQYYMNMLRSAEITPKTINLDTSTTYTAEYTGSNNLDLDISVADGVIAGDTVKLHALVLKNLLPISQRGTHSGVKISKNQILNGNYAIGDIPTGITIEIVKKKITNLDIKITYDVYDNVYVTLLNKDGIVGDEIVKLVLGNNHLDLPVGTVLKLQQSMAVPGEGYEIIASMSGDNKDNYELVAYEDENGKMIYGTVTIVASCDVQYDGSCNCGQNHGTELTINTSYEVSNHGISQGETNYFKIDITEDGVYKISDLIDGTNGSWATVEVYSKDGSEINSLREGKQEYVFKKDSTIYIKTKAMNTLDYDTVKLMVSRIDIEFDCQSEEDWTDSVEENQVLYVKVNGKDGTMNDFYVQGDMDDELRFTYNAYGDWDDLMADAPYDTETEPTNEIYKDVCDTDDTIFVITITTAGSIIIYVE